MFGQVNPRNADPEGLGDILWRPTFHHVKVEHLELPLLDAASHSLQSLREQVPLPGRVPLRSELRNRRVRDALNRRGAAGVV